MSETAGIMVEHYLQALQNPCEYFKLSQPIITDEVDFRTIIGPQEFQHLVGYKLPDSCEFVFVTKEWLQKQIGELQYKKIFGNE